ncbi:polyamine transporter 1 [Histoplasma capsulatum]|uniref:Polyamine transporter 1 n=1 Tax=Ajellomyces capsulatus TaxID=5037 RepID=A0A8A1MG17_AJECA|nr:polyamine transporter 1 [Histoplasma capsulatum]
MGLSQTQSQSKDPNLVTWSGPEDPENPLNWSHPAKWAAVLIVSSFTFISPVSSTMVAPALAAIGKEFGITSSMEQVLVMSIFLLAYAVGPFLLGPLSEIFGRVVVLQLANLFYLVFNAACGFAQNKQQILAFRFLSGLGGSAPQAACISSFRPNLLAHSWAEESLAIVGELRSVESPSQYTVWLRLLAPLLALLEFRPWLSYSSRRLMRLNFWRIKPKNYDGALETMHCGPNGKWKTVHLVCCCAKASSGRSSCSVHSQQFKPSRYTERIYMASCIWSYPHFP